MGKIQVTLSGELFERLVAASEESMRPLATEAAYRIKLGLNGAQDSSVVRVEQPKFKSYFKGGKK